MTAGADLLTLGRRIRHLRTRRHLTLEALGGAVGAAPSLLSLVENGKREPRLALLRALAHEFGVDVAELLTAQAPDRRAALEIDLERAQRDPHFGALGLPQVKPSAKLPMPVLEQLVGLHHELTRRAEEAVATPEEARRANTELRLDRQDRGNYFPDIEALAEPLILRAGYPSAGAVSHRTVERLAASLGFEIRHVGDLPRSARSVTDLKNGRIYLPPASTPGGHGLRSLALQAIAHRVLGHQRPRSYQEFLRQRVEITYFAAACLMPLGAATGFLIARKKERDLAVEDFRDSFGVSHEAAAMRLTNLATSRLDMPIHFMRVSDAGVLFRGYANDGFPLPHDVTGAIEGQLVCRKFGARVVFDRRDIATEYYQYTDFPALAGHFTTPAAAGRSITPAAAGRSTAPEAGGAVPHPAQPDARKTPRGTFWESVQMGTQGPDNVGAFSISVGVPYAYAKWFRGRDTHERRASTCPDPGCCQRPPAELAARWADAAWPSARLHQQILAAMPRGGFPGVEDAELFAFLDRHAPTA